MINDIAVFLEIYWYFSVPLVALMGVQLWLYAKKDDFMLTPNDVIKTINQLEAKVIDIRTENEFKAGHIASSLNLDIAKATAQIKKLRTGKKNKPVIIVCANGVESQKLCSEVKKEDITKCYYLGRGIQFWKTEQLPLI